MSNFEKMCSLFAISGIETDRWDRKVVETSPCFNSTLNCTSKYTLSYYFALPSWTFGYSTHRIPVQAEVIGMQVFLLLLENSDILYNLGTMSHDGGSVTISNFVPNFHNTYSFVDFWPNPPTDQQLAGATTRSDCNKSGYCDVFPHSKLCTATKPTVRKSMFLYVVLMI